MTSPSSERTPAEILRAARKRIEDPERWTQRVHARTKQRGSEVVPGDPTEPPASCWCAVGALMAEGDTDPYTGGSDAFELLSEAAAQLYKRSWPPRVNDTGSRARAHPRVLAMYDRAIELAEAEA